MEWISIRARRSVPARQPEPGHPARLNTLVSVPFQQRFSAGCDGSGVMSEGAPKAPRRADQQSQERVMGRRNSTARSGVGRFMVALVLSGAGLVTAAAGATAA